ncbi:N-6 DNA methylase [Salegentibacter sp. Hel_I_6]|uniref:N-6 DNA methylase n=1 Tax=Salegentibacter sp. Hel_I_6 TaxID=1250278 RepID=UPI00056B03B7|nr:N-6 DNA methylase [Salegentibacter sp. Hel_I_6]
MKKIIEDKANEIWKAFDFHRGSREISDIYQLGLFLLLLKRKGTLPEFTLKGGKELPFKIEEQVYKCEIPEFIEIYQIEFKHRLQRFGDSSLNIFLLSLRVINLDDLDQDSFSKLFEKLLYQISEAQGKRGGEYLIPKKLSRFMLELVELPNKSLVYNPFAGVASFGVDLDENSSYVGQEINQSIWALGTLRFIAHNKKNGSLMLGDSLNDWREDTFFDLIISAPPFGKISHFNNHLDSSIKSCDEFIVKKGIKYLKSEGVLIALMPNSFLFSGGAYKALRKDLINRDLIEKIISMPAGILNNTGIQTSILVLNKNKKEKEFITLVDGTSFEIKHPRNVCLDYKKLSSLLGENQESKGLKKVNQLQVINNDYNLEVDRYFWEDDEEIEKYDALTPLAEILEEVYSEKIKDDEPFQLVSIKHLSNDNFDYNLKLEEIPIEKSIRSARKITESCLLVSRIGNDLKPTFFKYKGQGIAVSNNVMAFKLREDLIDMDYFFNELFSSLVQKQLSVYRRGASQLMIRKQDFLHIKISLPIPDKQTIKMKAVKESFFKAKEKEIALQKELLGYKDEAFREFASIKHTFRQYLNALKSNVSGTRKFISRNEGQAIGLETLYSKNLNRSLGQHLLSLEGTIDSMSHLLSTFNETKTKDETNETFFSLIDLVKESQNRFKNPEKFIFEKLYVDREALTDFSGYYTDPKIKLNQENFFTLFSNIVSNAVDHGFQNKKGNIIRTTITNDFNLKMHVIEISNNGSPLPEGFDLINLTTRGEKTSNSKGSGVGGADIKSIMNHYNGKIQLLNEPEAEFPVTYILKFPFHIEATL